jgi:H+/Cl- antiporter ClcA
MTHRIGIFLIVIGIILLISLVVTIQAGEFVPLLGIGAIMCLIIGAILAIQFRPKVDPATRFRTINKFRDRGSSGKKS